MKNGILYDDNSEIEDKKDSTKNIQKEDNRAVEKKIIKKRNINIHFI